MISVNLYGPILVGTNLPLQRSGSLNGPYSGLWCIRHNIADFFPRGRKIYIPVSCWTAHSAGQVRCAKVVQSSPLHSPVHGPCMQGQFPTVHNNIPGLLKFTQAPNGAKNAAYGAAHPLPLHCQEGGFYTGSMPLMGWSLHSWAGWFCGKILSRRQHKAATFNSQDLDYHYAGPMFSEMTRDFACLIWYILKRLDFQNIPTNHPLTIMVLGTSKNEASTATAHFWKPWLILLQTKHYIALIHSTSQT